MFGSGRTRRSARVSRRRAGDAASGGRSRAGSLAAAVAVALLAGACDDAPTESVADRELGEGETIELALLLADQSDDALAEETSDAQASLTAPATESSGADADPLATVLTDEISFTRVRDCPRGGELTVEGQAVRRLDRENATVTLDFEARKVHSECGVRLRGRNVVLNGDPHIDVTAHRMRVDRRPSGLQTTALEGTVAYEVVGGDSGRCEIDLEIELDPDARTKSVEGTLCGREIDRTVTWESDA